MSMTEEDSFEILWRQIDSKEYWVILTDSNSFSTKVEETYYKPDTPANTDFNLTLTPEFITIIAAKKNRMSFKQLNTLMTPYIVDQKETERLNDDAKREGKDIILIYPTIRESWKAITMLYFRLQSYITQKQIKHFGIENTIVDKCYYHNTILAEQMQENNVECPNKAVSSITGFNKEGGSMTCAPLCPEHYEKIVRWLSE